MKYTALLMILSLFTLQSCEFDKSVNVDLMSGISTKGDGLSADNVFLTVNDEEITRTSFIYGEIFYLNFNNIGGFKNEGEFVFPGMKLEIVSSEKDTVMQKDDMYANYTEGIDVSPLLLNTNITVANPMLSNKNYTLYVTIWDKKGKGTFKAEMDFDVVHNDKIIIENNNVTYDNIYLFSANDKVTITDNNVNLNDDIYLMFEGLNGFKEEDGRADFGLSIKATDAEGTVIIDEENLIGEEGMEITELNNQIAPNFTFSGADIKNPINCIISIWDKKSDAKIDATVNLELK